MVAHQPGGEEDRSRGSSRRSPWRRSARGCEARNGCGEEAVQWSSGSPQGLPGAERLSELSNPRAPEEHQGRGWRCGAARGASVQADEKGMTATTRPHRAGPSTPQGFSAGPSETCSPPSRSVRPATACLLRGCDGRGHGGGRLEVGPSDVDQPPGTMVVEAARAVPTHPRRIPIPSLPRLEPGGGGVVPAGLRRWRLVL